MRCNWNSLESILYIAFVITVLKLREMLFGLVLADELVLASNVFCALGDNANFLQFFVQIGGDCNYTD